MKNLYAFALGLVLTIALIGIVSAAPNDFNTVVAGKIYAQNIVTGPVVPNAVVNVTCYGEVPVSLNTTSLADGAYAVTFTGSECPVGANVSVFAFHPSFGSGSVNATVNDGAELNLPLNFAVGNVVLVPEFGLTVGFITIIGALGAFLVIRRK